MLIDDLLQSELFKKLSDSSQEVFNDEMQHAYESFTTKVVALSQSESDFQTVFRSLNLTRGELIFSQSLRDNNQVWVSDITYIRTRDDILSCSDRFKLFLSPSPT